MKMSNIKKFQSIGMGKNQEERKICTEAGENMTYARN